MDKIIKEHLLQSILLADFATAKKNLASIPEQMQSNILLISAYHAENLAFYCFVLSILLEKETAHWHSVASQMFMVPLCFINGSDALGVYHIRRAEKLFPYDIGIKEGCLMYYSGNPEPLFTKNEALQIIEEMLAREPQNFNALRALEESNRIKDILIDNKDFYSLLCYGRFEEARKLVENLNHDQLYDLMAQINHKELTLATYGYVISLLIEKEGASLHYFAACLLKEQLYAIKGANVCAYWHSKRACALAPDNKSYELWLQQFK